MDYSQLAGSSTIALSGTLTISTSASGVPVGTVITVVRATGGLTGRYSTVAGAGMGNEHWTLSYTGTTVTLTAAVGSSARRSDGR